MANLSDTSDGTAVSRSKSRRAAISIRLVAWFGFGVVFGGVPVLVAGLRSSMSAEGLNLTEVLGRGELFIVSAVIAGSAIGELVTAMFMRDYSRHPTPFKVIGIAFGCTTLIALAANTVAYMVNATPETIRDTSLWLFLITVIPSGAIIAMVAES